MGRITRAIVVLALPLAADIVPAVSAQVTGGGGFLQGVTIGVRDKQGGQSSNRSISELLDGGDEEGDGVIAFEIPGLQGTMDDPFYQDSFERTQLRPAISEDEWPDFTELDSDDDTLIGEEEGDLSEGYTGSDAGEAVSWMRSRSEAVDASNKEVAISEVLPTQEITPALARQICRSREFQPTVENYWIAGTDGFLRGYVRENWNRQGYRDFGLVRSLARKYLGNVGFRCSLSRGFFDSSACRVSCEEAVQNVGSLQDARRVYFALSSISGLAESLGAISDSLPKAAERVQFLVNEMPTTKKWFDSLSPQGRFLIQVQQYFGAVRSAAFAAALWTPVAQIAENALADLARARSNYDNACQVADVVDSGGEDPYRWDKLFDPNYEMAVSDIDFATSGAADRVFEHPTRPTDNWHGRAIERAKQVLKEQLALDQYIQEGDLEQARKDGYVVFQELLNSNMETGGAGSNLQKLSVTGDAVARVRITLSDILERLLAGGDISPDGSTSLSRLLKYGHYLPLGTARSISAFKSANLADKLSRNVFMRLFDHSFASQKLYISCTKDAQIRSDPQRGGQGQPAQSCARDNTGPQNLKACVDGQVCYLYRWSERKFDFLSRNRKPKDLDRWDEAPFNINPEDIIISSVKSHLQKLGRGEVEFPVDVQFAIAGSGIESLQDARTPGLFHIPVCLSQYNWNTQTSGYNTLCDTDPNCAAKSFPCNCGTWGAETESVWRGMGVWGGKRHDFYARDLCPKQIQSKLEDPLERYASYCRLDVRRNNPWTRVDGLQKFHGRDKYCEPILCTVELQGAATAAALDPEVAFSCMCKVKKGGRGCSMYGNMFDELWSQAWNSGCLGPRKEAA